MKHHEVYSPCCEWKKPMPSPPPRPNPPPAPWPAPCPDRGWAEGCASLPPGGFLMQRILASGRMHRRRQCYPLCLEEVPPEARPPYAVVDAMACGMPGWTEVNCPERGAILLQVTVPLALRLRDGGGCVFQARSTLRECLKLRLACPEAECWRGQIFVQAAVRLCGGACPAEHGQCETPLEVLLEGWMLSPCTMGRPQPAPCPDARPWYPDF